MKYIWIIVALVLYFLPARAELANTSVQMLSDEKIHQLSEWQGKPILVHFWASWCGPCVAELPTIVKLASVMPQITVLMVSVDENPEKAKAFLARPALQKLYPRPLHKIFNLVVLQDSQKTLAQDIFGSFRYPETVLLDAQLKPVYKWVGAQEWSAALVLNKLNNPD